MVLGVHEDPIEDALRESAVDDGLATRELVEAQCLPQRNQARVVTPSMCRDSASRRPSAPVAARHSRRSVSCWQHDLGRVEELTANGLEVVNPTGSRRRRRANAATGH
jgi:hypothetical protein